MKAPVCTNTDQNVPINEALVLAKAPSKRPPFSLNDDRVSFFNLLL